MSKGSMLTKHPIFSYSLRKWPKVLSGYNVSTHKMSFIWENTIIWVSSCTLISDIVASNVNICMHVRYRIFKFSIKTRRTWWRNIMINEILPLFLFDSSIILAFIIVIKIISTTRTFIWQSFWLKEILNFHILFFKSKEQHILHVLLLLVCRRTQVSRCSRCSQITDL